MCDVSLKYVTAARYVTVAGYRGRETFRILQLYMADVFSPSGN